MTSMVCKRHASAGSATRSGDDMVFEISDGLTKKLP